MALLGKETILSIGGGVMSTPIPFTLKGSPDWPDGRYYCTQMRLEQQDGVLRISFQGLERPLTIAPETEPNEEEA